MGRVRRAVSGPCENADIMTQLIELKLLNCTPTSFLTAVRLTPILENQQTIESHCGVMLYPHGNQE